MTGSGRVLRAQRRFAWRPPGADRAWAGDIERVVLPAELRLCLTQELYRPARLRGGLLFGDQQGPALRVMLAGSLGEPGWYGGPPQSALEVDPRFTLGWTEALRSMFGGRLDWCGQWRVHPDGELRGAGRDGRLFRAGQRLGLFEDGSVLLLVGWEAGVFGVRAYRRGERGRAEALPVLTAQEGQGEWLRQVLAGE